MGFRPGYRYRVKLTGITGHPELALAPTLEVRGSLCTPLNINPAKYPAPVVFSDTDLEHILDGVFVTRVVYLEHPDKAVPTATQPNQPVERTLPASDDLWESAKELGRPMMIVRLGERQADENELRQRAIPGTILFPGERSLAPPALPPCVPWAGIQMTDSVLGPRLPEEECLQDGGTSGRPARMDSGHLAGLNPSDTVAEYTDSLGHRRLVKSNRVCLFVPRFALLRNEVPLAGLQVRTVPGSTPGVRIQQELGLRLPSMQTAHQEQPGAMGTRVRAGGAVGEQGVVRLVRLDVLDGYQMAQSPGDLLGTIRAPQLTGVERLRLTKQMAFARSFLEHRSAEGVEQTKAPAVIGRIAGMKLVSATAELRDVTAICNEAPRCSSCWPIDRFCCTNGPTGTPARWETW